MDTAALATMINAIVVISQATNNFGVRRGAGCVCKHTAPEHFRCSIGPPQPVKPFPDWEPHLCQQPGLSGAMGKAALSGGEAGRRPL